MANRTMDILTFNVRSLISYSRRVDLVNTLKCNKIDVAFLQETRLSSSNNIVLENYSLIKDESSIGVAIAIKENYGFRRVPFDSSSFPSVFVEVLLLVGGLPKKILVGSLYIPCNLNYSLLYNGLSAIKTLSSSYDGVVLGGDFNAKHVSWGDILNNSNGIALYNWIAHFCSDFVRFSDVLPSFPTGNSFLNHFLVSAKLVNTPNPNFSISTLPSFSDHFSEHFQLKLLYFFQKHELERF